MSVLALLGLSLASGAKRCARQSVISSEQRDPSHAREHAGGARSPHEGGARIPQRRRVLTRIHHTRFRREDRRGGGLPQEYDVDGAGRRVGRRVLDAQGTEIEYRGWIYRDLLRPIAEVDAAGNVVARYVYGDSNGVIRNMSEGLYAKLGVGGGFSHIHWGGRLSPRYIVEFSETRDVVRVLAPIADEFGNVYLVVDAADGSVVQRREYAEFGQLLADSAPDLYPFGYGGGLLDPATGLTRFGARDVDHSSGRWLARDPVRFKSGSMNLFLHGDDDPLNALDPTGLATYKCKRPFLGPIDHEYVCVKRGKTEICNGQTTDSPYGGLYSEGAPSNKSQLNSPDTFSASQCDKVHEDDNCMDFCIAMKLGDKRRPTYGIGPQGTDCWEWADDTIGSCEDACGG